MEKYCLFVFYNNTDMFPWSFQNCGMKQKNSGIQPFLLNS